MIAKAQLTEEQRCQVNRLLSTCQHDLCTLTREYIITPSLRDGLLSLTPFLALRARLLSCVPPRLKRHRIAFDKRYVWD